MGFLLLVLVGVVAAGGAVLAGGRSQEVVFATEGGEIVSVEPVSGEGRGVIYAGEGYATAPSRAGGSRSLAFSTLVGEGRDLRGDVYSVDLVRLTRARLTAAGPGEVYALPEFSPGRSRVLASRYGTDGTYNVSFGPSSGASRSLLEPGPVAGQALGPVWTSDGALYAWRTVGEDDGTLALTAYDVRERRRVEVLRRSREGVEVGLLSYHADSNTLLFAERDRGAPLAESRIRVLAGSAELPLRGAGGVGLYDPSAPIAALGGKMAVMWTDGKDAGVGLLDPMSWTFEKTAVGAAPGARYPQVSRDGRLVAVGAESGATVSVSELESGEAVREIGGVQKPRIALDRIRKAGSKVPPEAEELAPPSFGWRSLEEAS